tara:strand:- start:287 stop:463 length:177 start_codon:yes stop_codon:yes gene_type:complete
MKFSDKKPVVLKNEFDYMMWDLQREFNKFLIINAVVNSYCTDPCEFTKQRLNNLKRLS